MTFALAVCDTGFVGRPTIEDLFDHDFEITTS